MRTTIAIATFLAVGAGAAGVSALDLKGSDTLKELSQDLFGNNAPFAQDCGGTGNTPAGSINYIGSGSGNGQSAVLGSAPTQQIAPMSRGFNNGVCTATDVTHAEGVVFALDGLSVLANNGNFGSTACNGTISASCVQDPTTGLALAKTVALPGGGSYTFTDWRDVLRVLYAGMSTPADANLADRNCGSAVRQALAANWSLLFQGACPSGNCPAGVKHAFRRNEESGTTDVFVTLLQLPTASQGGNLTSFCNVATKGSGTFVAATGVFTPPVAADTNSGPMPTPPAGFGATPVPTAIGGVDGARYFGPTFTDFQDGDVIRRPCDGNGLVSNTAGEDVCSARGDLGLVLPIWDAPVVNSGESAFPAAQCSAGLFAVFSNELKVNHCSNFPSCFDACPNGVKEGVDSNSLLSAGNCAYPVRPTVTSATDPRCLNTKANKLNAELAATTPNNVDGRVYNLHLWSEDLTSPGTFVHAKAPRASGQNSPVLPTVQVSMVGAYYRIHQSHTLATVAGSPAFCQQGSATDQIGCLVQASPCSIGYAGREGANVAVNGVQGAISLKNNGIDPQTQCVRNLIASTFFPAVGGTYPIARRLFLNTMKGFDQVTGDENKAAVCFQNRNITDPIATARGFITLSPTAAGRPSYCFDFNEQAICTASANVDQCKNHLAGSLFPKCEETEDPATCH